MSIGARATGPHLRAHLTATGPLAATPPGLRLRTRLEQARALAATTLGPRLPARLKQARTRTAPTPDPSPGPHPRARLTATGPLPAPSPGSPSPTRLHVVGGLVAGVLGASLGWWSGQVASQCARGLPGVAVLGLVCSLWCAGSARRDPGPARPLRFAVDRTVRLTTALSVHPVLACCLLPLLLPVRPAAPRVGLTGEAADAARTIRRILRVAVEPDNWPELTGWPVLPLLVRSHEDNSHTVAAATARDARAVAVARLRASAPLAASLLLAAVASAFLPGAAVTEAQAVMLLITVASA